MADTKFKPGQSGNPAGRPKGSLSLTGLLRKKLEEGENANDVIVSTMDQAKVGNPAAMKILWDRMEGPMATVAQVTLDDVSNLSESERVARIAAIYDAARTRGTGSVIADDPEEGS